MPGRLAIKIMTNGVVIWTGSPGGSAFGTNALSTTTTYTITGTDSAGVVHTTAPAVITVTPVPVTLSISPSPASVTYGQASVVTWSCKGASTCTITKNGAVMWTGSAGGSAFTTGPLSTTTSYIVSGKDMAGVLHTSNPAVVTVVVPTVTLSISASPTTISTRQSSVVTWSCQGASTCTITKNGGTMWTGSAGGSAFSTGALSTTTTYVISGVDLAGGLHASAPATVTVTPVSTSTAGYLLRNIYSTYPENGTNTYEASAIQAGFSSALGYDYLSSNTTSIYTYTVTLKKGDIVRASSQSEISDESDYSNGII